MTKPFDPTKPIQTRAGRAARIICADRRDPDGRTIVACFTLDVSPLGPEYVGVYLPDGRKNVGAGYSDLDLVNIPERGYIVVWETRDGKLFVCCDVFRTIEARDAYIREIRARPNPLTVHSIHEIAL